MPRTPCLHQVQFYGADDALGSSVSDVLAVPILRGEAAFVVASPKHRSEFAAELTASGVDVAAARSAGRYLERDAAGTLAELLGPQGIDRERFRDVLGNAIIAAGVKFGAVSVYGELVGLLAAQGQLVTALELEALWSELMHEQRFQLLCGYPRECFTEPAERTAWARVCSAHDAIAPDTAASRVVRLLAGPQGSMQARQVTREVCLEWGSRDPAWLDDAVLVVAELVCNGVQHSNSPITLGLALRGGRVTVSVADGLDTVPVPRATSPLAENGRGFAIIDVLADGWGVEPQPRGKRVWVRLRPGPSDDAVIDLRDGASALR